MTHYERQISDEEAVPKIDTDIFHSEQNRRFAVGVLGFGTALRDQNDPLFNAYLRLRGNVYIDQTGFIDSEKKQEDGAEIDHNDHRSLHIVGIENRLSHVAIVACKRLIFKTEEFNTPLPIEEEFEDELRDTPIPTRSLEVSRLIVRGLDKQNSGFVRTQMYAKGLSHVVKHDLGPTFAVVEEGLERSLRKSGISTSRITPPKYLNKYDQINTGIEIDTHDLAQKFGQEYIESIDTSPGSFTYWGDVEEKAA